MDSKIGGPKSFLRIHKSKVVSTNRLLLRPARTLKLAHIKLPLLLFAWKVQMFLKLRSFRAKSCLVWERYDTLAGTKNWALFIKKKWA
jgi:hypothetical protein